MKSQYYTNLRTKLQIQKLLDKGEKRKFIYVLLQTADTIM